MLVAADRLEAEALVVGRLLRCGAQAHLRVALLARSCEQRVEKLLARALASARRDDCDRHLGRLLVDEAEARLLRSEEAEPGGAVSMRSLEREHTCVAATAPV